MAETSSLILKVDSRDVKTAKSDLDSLASSASNAEKSANVTTSSFLSLNKVLTAGAIVGVTMQYIKLADTMTGIQSKLKLVTTSAQELATAQEELFKIAQKTRQGYAETVDTFSNFAVAMGNMGKSQKEILRVTETVNKAIAISGGTAQQAAAATMQLGQAFASGTLRGDELNSILENSKGLAQAIADGMGVPIGKLRELGSEGKITAEVLAAALEKSASSVDQKFGKVGVTVSASVTTMENSLLKLVGTADQAMNGSGGIAEVFTYFAEAMDNNNEAIIESGKDAFRALQVMGVGLIQFGASFYQAGVAIPTAIALAIDAVTQLMENGINDLIELAEIGANEVKSIYGGKNIKLGRVDIDTNISKGLLKHYNSIVDVQKNAIATQGQLFDEIMRDTTELKKVAPPSDKGGARKGGATAETAEQKKARENAEKEAEQLQEDIAKAKLDAMRDNADRETDLALSIYQAQLDAEQKYYDDMAQIALDAYTAQEQAKQDSYDRQSQMALSFYEMTLSDKEKINSDMLALYEANEGLFNDEQMQSFFTKWQESIDGVKGGYDEISSMVDNLKLGDDFSESFTGVAKSIENMSKALKNFSEIAEDVENAKQKINSSKNLTQEQKSVELKKLENKEMKAQVNAYSNLAGAASMFFKEGSEGAKTLAIAQSALAMISAGLGISEQAKLPFPANIAAMAATAATVFSFLNASGIMGGGGSASSGGSSSWSAYSPEKLKSQYEPMTDRLDKQIELLEAIERNGSAQSYSVRLASTEFERDMRIAISESFASKSKGGTLKRSSDIYESLSVDVTKDGTRKIDPSKIQNISTFVKFAGEISDDLDAFIGKKTQDKQLSLDKFITTVQGVISDFALSLVNTVDEMSSAKDSFKEIFDEITGTSTYALRDLESAYQDVNLLIGDSDLSSYLSTQISTIEQIESQMTDSIYNILMSTDPSDFESQVQIMESLSDRLGVVFDGGIESALNYVDSINMVAESMARSIANIKSFEDSLLSEDQLLIKRLEKYGLSMPITTSDVQNAFEILKGGIEGLTDDELNLLQDMKKYVESLNKVASSASSASKKNDDLSEKEKDMAKAAEEAAREAARLAEELARLKQSGIDYLDSFREFAVGDDPLALISYKLDKFGNVLKGTGVNADNFIEKFSLAIQSGLTEESLEYWIGLGDAIQGISYANKEYNSILEEQKKRLDDVFTSMTDFVNELRGTGEFAKSATFEDFNKSFIAMNDAITSGSENMEDATSSAMNMAKSYLTGVETSASSQRDIDFAKLMIASKFESVTPKVAISTKPVLESIGIGSTSGGTMTLNNQIFYQSGIIKELSTMRSLLVKLTADNSKMLTIERAMMAEAV